MSPISLYRIHKMVLFLFVTLLISCSSPKNISKASVISERKIDFTCVYELKALNRTATAATIQQAISQLLQDIPDGLFIENVEIVYLKKNKVTITGDVWGKASAQIDKLPVVHPKENELPGKKITIGDRVQFTTRTGIVKTGKVVSIRGDLAVIQTLNRRNQIVQLQIPLISLKKY